eukprot:Blabericola_migrator_1__3300@NODE_1973_length_3483_cov_102_557377_g1256_i0_p2_GENE_NODE_1973_length_3483_cov_102_557377_g1256_i0NODE_1973_length_3483_cov_102_557377_g1256_i0_p2_ORF_typecomplete_len207_score34_99_NODE_1973_length_3483_cov_102_557377_g1256_i0219839
MSARAAKTFVQEAEFARRNGSKRSNAGLFAMGVIMAMLPSNASHLKADDDYIPETFVESLRHRDVGTLNSDPSDCEKLLMSRLVKEIFMYNQSNFYIRQGDVACLRAMGLLDDNYQFKLPNNNIEDVKDHLAQLLLIHFLDSELLKISSPQKYTPIATSAAMAKADFKNFGAECLKKRFLHWQMEVAHAAGVKGIYKDPDSREQLG